MKFLEVEPYIKLLHLICIIQHLFIRTLIHVFKLFLCNDRHFKKTNKTFINRVENFKLNSKEQGGKEMTLYSRMDFVYFLLICTLGLMELCVDKRHHNRIGL